MKPLHTLTTPDGTLCGCGYRVKWYTEDPNPDTTSVFYELAEEAGLPHLDMHKDVLYVDCPHHNGTVIELCPKCHRQVGMWGCGPAGSMECACWDMPRPWWRRLLRLVGVGVGQPE